MDEPLALEAGQPLDPEQAVQLIDLMLMADRAQPLRLLGMGATVDIPIADPDTRMTLNVIIDAGHRDAAFPMHDHVV